mgnify:CR=1 FL=1
MRLIWMAILDLAFVFRSRVDSTKLHEKLNYLHLIFLTMTGFDAKYSFMEKSV